MPANLNSAETVSRVITGIANSGNGITVPALASNTGVSEEFVISVIQLLSPFGAITISQPERSISPVSTIAADFLKGFASLVENNACLVQDWHREGTHFSEPKEILERGVCLLHLMEQRRSELRGAMPISHKRIANIIVKAIKTGGEPVFLMVLNDRSQAYQFIGRKVQRDESFENGAHRIVATSMQHANLVKNRDYQLQKLTDVITTQFVSPTYGSLTSFETVCFRMALSKLPVLSPNHRWCSLHEIQEGKTRDGYQIIPPKEVVRAHYMSFLEQMEISFSGPVETPEDLPLHGLGITASDNKLPIHALPHSQKNILIATLCAIAILGGTIIGLSYASTSQKFYTIIATVIPILAISLLFVAAASGIISGRQMIDGFKSFGKSSSQKGARRDKKNP